MVAIPDGVTSELVQRAQPQNLKFESRVWGGGSSVIFVDSGAFFVPVEPVYAHRQPEVHCIHSLRSLHTGVLGRLLVMALFCPTFGGLLWICSICCMVYGMVQKHYYSDYTRKDAASTIHMFCYNLQADFSQGMKEITVDYCYSLDYPKDSGV